MTRLVLILSCSAALAACGQGEVNAPGQPAEPITSPTAQAPAAVPPPGAGVIAPGTGPQSFVGRWAADVSWCADTDGRGDGRPIEITPTRIEGYENSCAIDTITQDGDGYIAGLTCLGEGMTSRERVRLAASGQSLRMTYLDRDGATVTLTKCTTLRDTTPTPPSLGALTKSD